jgi:hypothetical protein
MVVGPKRFGMARDNKRRDADMHMHKTPILTSIDDHTALYNVSYVGF